MSETQTTAAVHERLLDAGFNDSAIAVHLDDRLARVIELEPAASEGLVLETVCHEPSEVIAVAVELLAGIDELRVARWAMVITRTTVVSVGCR